MLIIHFYVAIAILKDVLCKTLEKREAIM